MKTVFALLTVALLMSCNQQSDELQKKNAELMQNNSTLNHELMERDNYINHVTQSINEVSNNIERIKAKEKLVLKETGELESGNKLTSAGIRERLLTQISLIDSTLKGNQKKLNDLQNKLSASRKQYAGLKEMVDNLKKNLEEREQAIAQLEVRVNGLQGELAEKAKTIEQQGAEIVDKTVRLNTSYYIVGNKEELEQKGIIKNEGGFLWGALGSTTVLASGFDKSYFFPMDKTRDTTLVVNGKINEIIPKRDDRFYSLNTPNPNASALSIKEPERFWQDKYLVIITD